MSKIKNRQELSHNGKNEHRKIVLDILEQTLEKMDVSVTLEKLIDLRGGILRIGKYSWNLALKRHVYLICGGKAANSAAHKLEALLGDYFTAGVAIVKDYELADRELKSEVFVGGHPLPNDEGYRGCMRILELVKEAGKDDLFISVISGGTSALMACPIERFTLEEEILTADVCLKSGATIHEINAIRRHISRINGGQLAKQIERKGAQILLLMQNDSVDEFGKKYNPDEIAEVTGGPMAPDNTTFADAQNVIRCYQLENKIPKTIVDYIMNGDDENETPKKLSNFAGFFINSIPDLCSAAKEAAKMAGYNSYVLTSSLTGSSREAGRFFAAVARGIIESESPCARPVVLVAGGEVNTLIDDPKSVKGQGGPGQEMAIAFAEAAKELPGACFLSIDSDGTDGPTDAAGGIVDNETFEKSLQAGIDLNKSLQEHSGYLALKKLNSLIFTGNTGTTLCDLHILYIP